MVASKLQSEIRQTRPFEQTETLVLLNLARTASVLRVPVESLIKEHGLSVATYNVLRILRGAHPTGLPCSEIGARMITRVPDVTRLLDRLEKDGLAERRRDRDDRRVVLTTITADGLERLEALDQPVRELERALLAHMSEEDMLTLSSLLELARDTEGDRS